MLLILAFLTDLTSPLINPTSYPKLYYKSYANILFYLSSFFFLVVLIQNPTYMMPADLDNDLSSLGFTYTLFVFSSILLLLFSCFSGSHISTIISSLYLLHLVLDLEPILLMPWYVSFSTLAANISVFLSLKSQLFC